MCWLLSLWGCTHSSTWPQGGSSGQFLRTSVSSLCSGGVGMWVGFREPHSSEDLHLKLVFYSDRQALRHVPLLCLVSLHSVAPWLVSFPLL